MHLNSSVFSKFLLRSLGVAVFYLCISVCMNAQSTLIKGFIDAGITYEKDKVAFNFGEQDLFITSKLSDRFSFLGETVFKFDSHSETNFSVSIERVVLKYNINGNHNLLIGKHHTPLNYWNDTYHHGRLFFPTIDRPLLFSAGIVPLHTTGISLQGHDLGKLKWGYDLMIGNGLGSADVSDNDNHKSYTAAIHCKPVDRLRIGASYYYDVISAGAEIHQEVVPQQVNQQLYTGSVSYFGKKIEVLAEATTGVNQTDSTGNAQTLAMYVYGGYKLSEKWIPYFRFDKINYDEEELFYNNNDATAYLLGLRYQVNYLVVLKLEYQHEEHEVGDDNDRVKFQAAIGF